MTSPLHNIETWSGGGGGLTGISLAPREQYEAVYVSAAEEELKQRVQSLESDLACVRGMLLDLYDKCPKTKSAKAKNKSTDIECENCGGLLW